VLPSGVQNVDLEKTIKIIWTEQTRVREAKSTIKMANERTPRPTGSVIIKTSVSRIVI